MRKRPGYSTLFGPGLDGLTDPGLASLQKFKECDTFTCNHCQKIVHVPPMINGTEVGGFCMKCDSLVCNQCKAKQTCTPVEKQIEDALKRTSVVGGWF